MGRFIPISEAIEDASLFGDDILQQLKMRYHRLAKYVWDDLNLTTVKNATRVLLDVNKRTNTVDLPCNYLDLSGVSIMNENGSFTPVFMNQKLHDDLVDVNAGGRGNCTCNYELCNMIKGYEGITSYVTAPLPDGNTQQFTCITRRGFLDGHYYEEKQAPQAIYTDGVWTSTQVVTTNTQLCALKTDKKGCVTDCEENYDAILACSHCAVPNNQKVAIGGDSWLPPSPNVNTWIYYCSSKADIYSTQCGCYFSRGNCRNQFNDIYNISELGNRLIFPKNFGHKKVLIRYYESVPLEKMTIPFIAVPTFIMGLKYYYTLYNDNMQRLNDGYNVKYAKMKWGLLGELNKYTVKELGSMFAQKTYMPSYFGGNYAQDVNY